MKTRIGLYIATFILMVVTRFGALPGTLSSVEPVFVFGSPTCADMGFDYSYVVSQPDPGTYSIGGFNSVTVTTDGVSFEWTASQGIKAVISTGGSNSNLYLYRMSFDVSKDSGLNAPVNVTKGRLFELSHIELCFNHGPDRAQASRPSATETYYLDYVDPAITNVDDRLTGIIDASSLESR